MRRPAALFSLLLGLATSYLLASCGPPAPGSDLPGAPQAAGTQVSLDGTTFQLVDAQFRRSYQTHYLMSYPPDGHSFLMIRAAIEGTDDPLGWAREHTHVLTGSAPLALVHARPVLIGEDIQYRSDYPFEFEYEFFYRVPEGTTADELSLVFPDGSRLPLAGIGAAEPRATALPILGSVLAGSENSARGEFSVVGGGSQNHTGATHASILGGRLNRAGGDHSVIAGGRENEVQGFAAAIAGGFANRAQAREAVVAGGSRNSALARYSAVSGGIQNVASGSSSTVSGGAYNVVDAIYASIAGGTRNTATADAAAVGGGGGNTAGGQFSAVVGGLANRVDGDYASVGGGYGNHAAGSYASVVGGEGNQASGDWSLAAGRNARVSVDHNGAILLADSSTTSFVSRASDEFAVRATGGVRLVTGVGPAGQPASGAILPSGSGSWAMQSDQNAKTAFGQVDQAAILEGVRSLPLSSWSYSGQDGAIRHVGPAAQDFYATFGFGEDERHISAVDADGVALAAIQALDEQAARDREVIEGLQARVRALEARAERGQGALGWLRQAMLLALGSGAGYFISKRTAEV